MKIENLEQAFSQFNIEKIEKLEQLFSVFTFGDVTNPTEPLIVTKQKSLIILDNKDFNTTYLIDLVCKILDKFKDYKHKLPEKIYYIDNPILRWNIINPNKPINGDYFNFEGNLINVDLFEMNELIPCIICINPELNLITLTQESKIGVITEGDVEHAFNVFNKGFDK